MAALLATVGAYAGLALLLASGVEHARRPAAFRDLVARQAVWPRPLVTPLAAATVLAELAIGLAGLVSVLAPRWSGETAPARAATLLAAAALYLAFALYGLVLVRRRPGVPCGCAGADHPVNALVPARALVLAAGCGLAAAEGARVLAWSRSAEFLLAAVAGAAVAALAWSLPTALHHEQEVTWTSRPAR